MARPATTRSTLPEPHPPGDPPVTGPDDGPHADDDGRPAYPEADGGAAGRVTVPDDSPPGRLLDRAADHALLKPMDIKRLARVPYETVLAWLTVGHPRAGVLPSIDLAQAGKRHSYRIRRADWEAFLARLQTVPRERQRARPQPRPAATQDGKQGMFRY
jgi:hypothetical protein